MLAAAGSLALTAATAALAALSPAPASAAALDRSRVMLSGPGGVWRWASVDRSAVARRHPRDSAARVGRLSTRTNEETTNIVQVLERVRDSHRVAWVRVRLAVLPNGRSGWVPRAALGEYRTTRTRLIVDRRRLRATLARRGRVLFRAPVGVGTSRWPTPRGEFYVRLSYSGFADPAYGPLAFGTSARSTVLTEWPGGGFIGIHGTDRPELIPGRVSHGCIRLRNHDIVRLARWLKPGMPITIR